MLEAICGQTYSEDRCCISLAFRMNLWGLVTSEYSGPQFVGDLLKNFHVVILEEMSQNSF
jgi:hypothetical protein